MCQITNDKTNLYKLNELKCTRLSILLPLFEKLPLCGFFRDKLLRKIISLGGGIFNSYTVRQVLFQKQNVTLGSYSYGNLADLYQFPVKTIIGRYTSIGSGVRIFQANHPTDFVSMHPFFSGVTLALWKKRQSRDMNCLSAMTFGLAPTPLFGRVVIV